MVKSISRPSFLLKIIDEMWKWWLHCIKLDHLPTQLYISGTCSDLETWILALRLCAYCFTIQKIAKSLGKTHWKQVSDEGLFFLMWEIFQMALIQILICYACLASSNLTQTFPKLPQASKSLLLIEGNTYFLITSLREWRWHLLCTEAAHHTGELGHSTMIWACPYRALCTFCPNTYG